MGSTKRRVREWLRIRLVTICAVLRGRFRVEPNGTLVVPDSKGIAVIVWEVDNG